MNSNHPNSHISLLVFSVSFIYFSVSHAPTRDASILAFSKNFKLKLNMSWPLELEFSEVLRRYEASGALYEFDAEKRKKGLFYKNLGSKSKIFF